MHFVGRRNNLSLQLRVQMCTHMCFMFLIKTLSLVFRLIASKLTLKTYWLRDVPTTLTLQNCTFCPHRIYEYVFCIYLKTNSDLCHFYHKLIGFYNRVEKCLQRGMNWFFK
jgi:hypothetical protein